MGEPSDAELTPVQLQRLASLLQLPAAELNKRSPVATANSFTQRHLPPEQAAKVIELGIPGIFLQREYRRYYPTSEYSAHLIGFTDIDDKGQEALELAFDISLPESRAADA